MTEHRPSYAHAPRRMHPRRPAHRLLPALPAAQHQAAISVLILSVIVVIGSSAAMSRPRSADTHPTPAAVSALRPIDDTKSILFLGDSYTIGPTSLPDLGYACLTASALGWNCNLAAQAAAGYISGGPEHRTPRTAGNAGQESFSLFERIPRMRALYDADVVVLDAGRNDLSYGTENLDNLLVYTVERAQAAWPQARIVVIAPWLMTKVDLHAGGDSTGPSVASSMEERLRSDPAFDGVVFLSPPALGWFDNEDVSALMAEDGIHPNLLGHQIIARKLTAALTAAGIGAG